MYVYYFYWNWSMCLNKWDYCAIEIVIISIIIK